MKKSLEKKLKEIPRQPGCYLYKDAAGQVIYIGKAKDLRKRVSSYFQKKDHDPKTRRLVTEIADLEYIVTNSEVEALLLEARMIRQQQPKYNMELKGGMRYAYIRLTDEDFPRLETVRAVGSKDTVFGPFTSGQQRRELIGLANYLFKLRSSKRKPVKAGDKFQIGISTPPWRRLVTQEEYQQDVEKAVLLLKNKARDLIHQLTQEMGEYADKQQYELARLRRDQISALENLGERQSIELVKTYDQDVINYIVHQDTIYIQLFNINRGVVSQRQAFTFSLEDLGQSDEHEIIKDFLSLYYFDREVPREIVVPIEFKDQEVVAEYMEQLAGHKVAITVPQRGAKKSLLELVEKNIVATIEQGSEALFELQKRLSLPTLPLVIECFDVSNLGNQFIVGSMVHFRNGQPDKNHYRRFKVKWQSGQSDFDAMHEIVYRRYYRIKAEKAELPNLIMVDGGKPQLTAAKTALKELGLQVPLVALAKKEEELFLPGRKYSIRIPKRSDALKLVQKIRDEAHRFAITYNRLLRKKEIG